MIKKLGEQNINDRVFNTYLNYKAKASLLRFFIWHHVILGFNQSFKINANYTAFIPALSASGSIQNRSKQP